MLVGQTGHPQLTGPVVHFTAFHSLMRFGVPVPAVLIAEDSLVVQKILRHLASRELTFDIVCADSRAQALQVLETRDDWFAAIVDLNLPDAPDGELIDDVLAMAIPTIVLTGSVDADRRDNLSRRGIVDYVLKEGRYSYKYAINLVNRLLANKAIKVLVAEDSGTARRYIVELLRRQNFQAIEAEDGQQALEILLADNDIKILLTDYNMPRCDGFELIHELRHRHDRTDLAIIGLSSADDKYLSAKFIKNGANDFLYKPFSHEEFFCRVTQAVESMERLELITAMAYSDPLTGVGNRRFYVEKARVLIDQAQTAGTPLSLAIVDIDHFKKVNDTYGHDVGDEVLLFFAKTLAQAFQQFVVARTGGEEFFILFSTLTSDEALAQMEAVRQKVAASKITTDAGELGVTFSGGLASLPADNVESLMKAADERLYEAKGAGRNTVVGNPG